MTDSTSQTEDQELLRELVSTLILPLHERFDVLQGQVTEIGQAADQRLSAIEGRIDVCDGRWQVVADRETALAEEKLREDSERVGAEALLKRLRAAGTLPAHTTLNDLDDEAAPPQPTGPPLLGRLVDWWTAEAKPWYILALVAMIIGGYPAVSRILDRWLPPDPQPDVAVTFETVPPPVRPDGLGLGDGQFETP